VQHLDRRFEHLDEFKHALVGEAQAAGIAVGVGIALRMVPSLRMSIFPTSEEMSWLFSSPGSVLVMAIWRSTEGLTRTTRNFDRSPPYSCRRLIAHGDMMLPR
jgi:hypothetical protein